MWLSHVPIASLRVDLHLSPIRNSKLGCQASLCGARGTSKRPAEIEASRGVRSGGMSPRVRAQLHPSITFPVQQFKSHNVKSRLPSAREGCDSRCQRNERYSVAERGSVNGNRSGGDEAEAEAEDEDEDEARAESIFVLMP